MKWIIEGPEGAIEIEGEWVHTKDGTLSVVAKMEEPPVFILGPGEWSRVREVGTNITTKADDESDRRREPAVPTKLLKRWAEQVREATPSGSFPFDADFFRLIDMAEGRRVAPEPPAPPPPRKVKIGGEEPPKGKLD